LGLGVVLLFWGVVLGTLAAIGAAILGAAVRWLTRGVPTERSRTVAVATLFPFLCLGWTFAVFLFQAAINETVFHRDAGLGDAWRTPLPNGYAILMIDTTDEGWVYSPATQSDGAVAQQDDAVSAVSKLQVAGRYILGEIGGVDAETGTPKRPSSYFLVDTAVRRVRGFPDMEALRAAARPLGVSPGFVPIDDVYLRYRYTWFDGLALALLLMPPGTAFLFLAWWVRRLRKGRFAAENPV